MNKTYRADINRLGFKETVPIITMKADNIDFFKTQRKYRTGINRLGFKEVEPKARSIPEFDRLKQLEEEAFGTKVRLSEPQIEQLFSIQVPDPSDTTFVAENRPQRTISRQVNIGQEFSDVNNAVKALNQAMVQGRVYSINDRTVLLTEIGKILGNQSQLSKVTSASMVALFNILDKLNLPKDPSVWVGNRLFNQEQYESEREKINTYLASNPNAGGGPDRPVIGLSGKPIGLVAVNKTIRDGNFLDIQERRIVNVSTARKMVLVDGVDDGKLGGVSITTGQSSQS